MHSYPKSELLKNKRANAATGGITENMVADATPNFWANTALGALNTSLVMGNLINRDYSSKVATKGDVVNITKRGTLVVNDKAAGQQITLQTPSTSKIPVTLNKHKEISWLIEDVADAKAIPDAIAYVQDAAAKLAEQIEKDILSLYSGLTLSVGTAATDLSVDTMLAARKALNDARCPTDQRYLILSSKDETALLKLGQFTSAQWSNENQKALREAILGRKYGFTILTSQLIPVTGASPKTTHNLAFRPEAYTLVTRPLPKPQAGTGAVCEIIEQNGVSVRVTKSYSQKDGGTLWTLDMLYGVAGMRDDTHAVDVKCETFKQSGQ